MDNPQSNGLVEKTLGVMKKLIRKTERNKEDFEEALLEFRRTPRQDGSSPALMFLKRDLRTDLPHLKQEYNQDEAEGQREKSRKKMKERSSKKRKSKMFEPGDLVWMQDKRKKWTIEGVIISRREKDNSYYLNTGGQKDKLRNRKFLKPRTASQDKQNKHDDRDEERMIAHPRRSERLKKGADNCETGETGKSVRFSHSETIRIFRPGKYRPNHYVSKQRDHHRNTEDQARK